MKHLKLYKEEFDISFQEIEKVEKIWSRMLPNDYKEFLLKNNGAVVYPNFPTISTENNFELFGIERFYSVGDLILQKLYPKMPYTHNDIDDDDFLAYNLKKENHLVFAQGDRGIYFFDLSPEDIGQIYFANYSDGDGIVKVKTNSFTDFLDSLDVSPWSQEKYNPDFELKSLQYSQNKIFQTYLFWTPENPELGLERFKEVFAVLGDIQPPEDGYPNIPQKYVDDKLKLDYLLSLGCNTDGLLRYTKNPKTIDYLVNIVGLDINKGYKGRFPLQSYLTPTYDDDIKIKYQLIDELLEMGIEMDWTIQGKLWNGEPDLSMLEKLQILHTKYYDFKEKNKKWENVQGFVPFRRSEKIERKLGI